MDTTKNTELPEKKSGQKYAELLCDFMFKRLFGSEANKDVLIGFLNMILEDHEITKVDFIPTEHLGPTEEDRKVVFDISCECQDGETLIIEMQKGFQTHFRKRIWELETVFDKWMYLLRHMHEMVEIPKEFDDSLFRRLFMLAEINNFTADEYEQYQKSLENMGDYQNIINTAVEEAEIRGRAAGLEQGLERGREEGREEEKKANALKLRELGVAVEIISQATGLSVKEIEKL